MVEKLLDIYFEWAYVVAERVSRFDFDVYCTNDDFAFKTGMMFSPKMFRTLLAHRYKRLREKIKLPWVVHSDGNIYEALEIFSEVGVNGVHPCENAAMDIRAAKKELRWPALHPGQCRHEPSGRRSPRPGRCRI